jgi:hypothetical protein
MHLEFVLMRSYPYIFTSSNVADIEIIFSIHFFLRIPVEDCLSWYTQHHYLTHHGEKDANKILHHPRLAACSDCFKCEVSSLPRPPGLISFDFHFYLFAGAIYWAARLLYSIEKLKQNSQHKINIISILPHCKDAHVELHKHKFYKCAIIYVFV